MFWTEHFLVDRQCSFVEQSRLNQAALALNRKPEVVQAHCGIGMFGAKHFFANRKRTFQKYSCLRIVAGRRGLVCSEPMQQLRGESLRILRRISVDQRERK